MPRMKQTKPRHIVEENKLIVNKQTTDECTDLFLINQQDSPDTDRSDPESERSCSSSSTNEVWDAEMDGTKTPSISLQDASGQDEEARLKDSGYQPSPKHGPHAVMNSFDGEQHALEDTGSNPEQVDKAFSDFEIKPLPSTKHPQNSVDDHVESVTNADAEKSFCDSNLRAHRETITSIKNKLAANGMSKDNESNATEETAAFDGKTSPKNPETTLNQPLTNGQLNGIGLSPAHFGSFKNAHSLNALKDPVLIGDDWKSWMQNQSVGLHAKSPKHVNLMNGYMKQIVDSWNAMLLGMKKPSESTRTSCHNSKRTSESDLTRERLSPSKQQADKPQFNFRIPTPNREDSLLNRNHPCTSGSAARKYANDSQLQQRHRSNNTPEYLTVESDKTNENKDKAFKDNSSLSSDSARLTEPTPITSSRVPKYNDLNSSYDDTRSTTEASALDFSKQEQVPFGSFYSHLPWPNPAWLAYNSPQVASLPSYFPYHHLPHALKAVQSQSLPSSSMTGHKDKSVHSPPEVKVSARDHSSPHRNSLELYRKSFDESAKSTASNKNYSAALEGFKRRCDLPLMPYSSAWLGDRLPSRSFQHPSSFSNTNPIFKFAPNNPPFLYPNVSPPFAQAPPISSSGVPSTHSAYSSYRSKTGTVRSSALGKLLHPRRSRTRVPAFDSMHAAIVREAKEQSKGIDPENMYIQCPICQKRIKRLYHFQRHMRIHTGEKTHQCPCCQYKSVRKDNLKSHMKTHEKQNMEAGRKSGKSGYHSNRYPVISNDASQSQFLEATGLSNAAKANDSAQESGLNLTKAKTKPYTQDEAQYVHESCSPKSPKSDRCKPQLELSERNVSNDAKNNVKEVSQFLKERKSSSENDNLLKNEGEKDRLNYIDLPGYSETNFRSKDGNISDVNKTTGETRKRALGNFQSYLDCGNAVTSKRPKVKNEKNTYVFDISKVKANSNNNNDRKRTDSASGVDDGSPLSYVSEKASKDEAPEEESSISSIAVKRSPIVDHLVFEEAALNHDSQNRCDSDPGSAPENPTEIASDSRTSVKARKPEKSQSSGADNSPPRHDGVVLSRVDDRRRAEERSSSVANDFTKSTGALKDLYKRTRDPLPAMGQSAATSFTNRDKSSEVSGHRDAPGHEVKKQTEKMFSEFETSERILNKEAHRNHQHKTPGTKGKSPKPGRLQNSPVPLRPLQCRLCSFTSVSNSELQTHVTARHKQDGFYKCDECSYLGKNLSKLVEHIRIHTGERPFKCDQCNYAAKRKDNLAQHKAVRHDKRKAKAGSQYSALGDLKSDSALIPPAVRGMPYFQGSKDPGAGSPLAFTSAARSAMPDPGLSPRLNLYGSFFGRERDLTNSPSTAGHMTPPLRAFPPFPNLSSLFQYPYYPQFPAVVNSPELDPALSGSVSKTVNSPGTYSMKVRALIAP